MKINTIAALGGVLLAAATAGTSLAQPAPQAPRPGVERSARPDPAAMAERRAEHLRAALQLRPDQEGALKTYLDARKRPEGLRERGGSERMAQMTTPQRLDAARTRMTERMAQFDQRAAATKRFYAQLSPSQQKAFDAMAPRGGGRGDHGGRGGRGGGHGPMGRGE